MISNLGRQLDLDHNFTESTPESKQVEFCDQNDSEYTILKLIKKGQSKTELF